jgi:sortase (surface protein transpeptidase)
MSSLRLLTSAANRLAIVLVAATLLAGSSTSPPRQTVRSVSTVAPAAASADGVDSGAATAVPAALTNDALSLRAAPVSVPLELRIPSLDVRASMLGVGMTSKSVMDAPMGGDDDPVWQQAFWYRGSAVPGARSTALIAGHINDSAGRAAVFAHIDRLRTGDTIVVHDTRSGLDVRFTVMASTTFSLEEAAAPEALAEIYGAGPVAGTAPQPSADGLAHLTLITCAGTFRNGTHDHRLVVFATRT